MPKGGGNPLKGGKKGVGGGAPTFVRVHGKVIPIGGEPKGGTKKVTTPAAKPTAKHKVVKGGVVVNKDISPKDYKEKTKNMKKEHEEHMKKWNSVHSIYTDAQGRAHLFQKSYDKEEFSGGAKNVERANRVKHVGAFKTVKDAKHYLYGGDEKRDLKDDKKSIVLSKQLPFKNKDMY